MVTIIALILSTCYGSVANSDGSDAVVQNHPQPGIWAYENEKNQPDKALVLELKQESWQFTAAACIAPVFVDRYRITPLFFNDGSEARIIDIPHENKTLLSFGSDISTASANIAKTYWTKAEIVIITDTYEHVLWLVPMASFLSAPILINPSDTTLQELGTKCTIVVGGYESDVDEVIKLDSKDDVWKFQLELFDTKGQVCNYVIITNPHDTDIPLNPDIKYPNLSLATAPLAAFRKAIVQTGDYTGDSLLLDQIHKKAYRDDQLYQQTKPYFEKVKADSYTAEKFLLNHEHEPEFICLVGGPFALPDYYYDIHAEYLYWGQELHYVPSASPYAILQETVSNNLTMKEDLGIGRIVGHSLLDATNQLVKTFFYSEYLPGGVYSNLSPLNWEQKSVVVDGHRLNQPRNGGPPHTSSNEPFHPAGEIESEFELQNLSADYIIPQNKTDPYDTNPSKGEILNIIQNYSMIQFIAHGGSMANPEIMWMEGGYDAVGEEENCKHKISASDIANLNLSPSVVYVIACHTGHIFLDMDKNDLLPLAFAHSGAVCYIAPVTCQSICFWDLAPEGVGATQAIYFWENLLSGNVAAGTALAEAKWSAYKEWKIDYDSREEPDNPAFHLFGDPAFEPYKTNISFDSKGDIDLHVSYEEVKRGKPLEVNVDLNPLKSVKSITDADIIIKFNGKTSTSYSASFDVPKESGDYELVVNVDKDGYHEITAKYIVPVESFEEEDNTWPILGFMVIIVAIIAIILVRKRKKTK
ncbi:MAG: hypothetical protein JSV09_13625 [Thermoplasmata archaeon]|nr:MAG: hypothetical protein JSV09_13625 [Thermoplasmata archaeon]